LSRLFPLLHGLPLLPGDAFLNGHFGMGFRHYKIII
jgi:hypothetical protein